MELPSNRIELLNLLAGCLGLDSHEKIDKANIKTINSQILKLMMEEKMSYAEIGYCIQYYCSVLKQKIQILYGISFVGKIKTEALASFQREKALEQERSLAAREAAEQIKNGEQTVINIVYVDKKPIPRKLKQLSYETIKLDEEEDDGNNQD
jgi:hypothetical protein